jgi:hypothetical protein
MTKKRKWGVAGGVLAVVVLVAAAWIAIARDPLLLPGSHPLDVYAVDDAISGPATRTPGVIGRAIGMCDADAYYVEDGDQRLCLVLSGPLGAIRAKRSNGKVMVSADEAAKLKTMATQDTGSPTKTTRLILMGGTPLALIPVTELTDGTPLSARKLG